MLQLSLIIMNLISAPVHAEFAISEVSVNVNAKLSGAAAVEEAAGKHKNARFYNWMKNRFQVVNLLWGSDKNRLCAANDESVTYAYTSFGQKKSESWINICSKSLEVLSVDQMVFLLIHELAHQRGVLDETQANYVADRAFMLNGAGNPFVFKDFREYIRFLSSVSSEVAAVTRDAQFTDTQWAMIEIEFKTKKETRRLWNVQLQGWDLRPYRQKPTATFAIAMKVWIHLGSSYFGPRIKLQ